MNEPKHQKPLISIVIPIFNEADNLPLLFDSLDRFITSQPDLDFEVIFVDDGSTDKSMNLITKHCDQSPQYKYIEFSRNFGKEIATTAGMENSTGDALVLLDADLQHPIEKIPDFIQKWKDGFEVIIGIRQGNKDEGLVKRWGSRIYYFLVNYLGASNIRRNATDFCLLDRKVVNEFNRLAEHNRMTRALIDWLGFRKTYIEYFANPRTFGQPSYNTYRLIRLAFTSFISNSLFPLKLAGYLGVLIMLVSAPLGIFVFYNKYITNDPWGYAFTGSAALAVILVFLIGIVLSCMGLIALYIANIHTEVSGRPLYVVRNKKI